MSTTAPYDPVPSRDPSFSRARGSSRHGGWWRSLGLVYKSHRVAGRRDPDQLETTQEFLRSLHPIAFERTDRNGQTTRLSIAQVAARVADLDAEQSASENRQAAHWARLREQYFLDQIEAAYASPGASATVESGGWAGFMRAEAAAWNWSLFQFEPKGFAHPGSQIRHEAMQALEAGGLPEVFGYPQRARVLVERGLTPRSYRQRREAQQADPLR